jgi:hypothetical protein
MGNSLKSGQAITDFNCVTRIDTFGFRIFGPQAFELLRLYIIIVLEARLRMKKILCREGCGALYRTVYFGGCLRASLQG